MKYYFILFALFFNCCVSKEKKLGVLSEKWFRYTNKQKSECLCKINFSEPLSISYYDNSGNILEKDQYHIKKNIVFIISSASLHSKFLKQKVDYSDIFFTKNNVCEMHTLVKKYNKYFIYSVNRIINDSTIVGKDINYNKFKRRFDSIDSYIEFLTKKEELPEFISYDFQRFYYYNCKFRWFDFYTYNKTDTFRQASFNEIGGKNYGLVLLDIRKLRSDFPNYIYY